MVFPLKKNSRKALVERLNVPQLSFTVCQERHQVLDEVVHRNNEEQPVVEDAELPVVEEEEDDTEVPVQTAVEITGLELLMGSSTDSSDFSFDTYAQDSFEAARLRMRKQQIQLRPSSRRPQRRMSNCSSIGEDESYGYEQDSVPQLRPDYGRYSSTRRASMGSYANDSVEYGRYNKTTRRSSLGTMGSASYANDSIQNMRSNSRPQRRFSNFSEYANDSVEMAQQRSNKPRTVKHDVMKRRLSNESWFSFAPEVYESQTINTGGANRAA